MSFRTPHHPALDIYLPPIPSESVLSWLVRIARANAIGLHELGSRIQGVAVHSTMNGDLDVLVNRRLSTGLARISGLSIEEIELAGLGSWDWLLSAEASGRRWILSPRKAPDGSRSGRWVQACFSCFAEDDKPFFRQHWRYAFITDCVVHQTPLHDACPRCTETLDYRRVDRGPSRAMRLLPLSVCPHCFVDWRIYGQRTQRSVSTTVALQRKILKGITSRWVPHCGRMLLLPLLLDGMHRLIRCFRTETGRRVASRVLGEHLSTRSKEQIERLCIHDRRPLMHALGLSLSDWPSSFLDSAAREGLTMSQLRERGPAPWWIEKGIGEKLDKSWYAPSPEEAASARVTLNKYGINATPWVLREWLGCHVPVRRLIQARPVYEPRQLSLWRHPEEVSHTIRAMLLRRISRILIRYCTRGLGRMAGEKQMQLTLEFTFR